jgi:hypothetical protein
MAVDVGVYGIADHKRSQSCCAAMYSGIKACGDKPILLTEDQYRSPQFTVAVFYGYTHTLRRIMADYVKDGLKAVYIDLGYWRREGMTGHHKITVNDRHPTAYFQNTRHPGDRAEAVGVDLKPWRHSGKHILLAGMGDKAAEAEGRAVESWERQAIEALRHVTDRPIIYRPKPSWLRAKPLPGTSFSPKQQSLDDVLKDCHAVVTHHSNVAVEAIVAGVPAFCWKGVAVPMSSQIIKDIEAPRFPDRRAQWCADIAYTQWNIDEMRRGLPWKHMKNEGLI